MTIRARIRKAVTFNRVAWFVAALLFGLSAGYNWLQMEKIGEYKAGNTSLLMMLLKPKLDLFVDQDTGDIWLELYGGTAVESLHKFQGYCTQRHL